MKLLSEFHKTMKALDTAYRSAVGIALVAGFVLVWMVLPVGVLGAAGDLADLMYAAVLAVGSVGVLIARFQPRGMARASFRGGGRSGASSYVLGSMRARRSRCTGRPS